MKRLLLIAAPYLLLATGCADPREYDAYNENNTCMQYCYGDNQLCAAAYSSHRYTGHPAEHPDSVASLDPLIYAFCSTLLTSCMESCEVECEEKESD